MSNESCVEGLAYTEPETICIVCNQHQTESRILPCQHSFCTLCLKLEFEAGCILPIVYCPRCRKRCKLDQLGVLGLPRNSELDTAAHYYKYLANQNHRSQNAPTTEIIYPNPYDTYHDSYSASQSTNHNGLDETHLQYSQPSAYYSTQPNSSSYYHSSNFNNDDHTAYSSHVDPHSSSSFASFSSTASPPLQYPQPQYGSYHNSDYVHSPSPHPPSPPPPQGYYYPDVISNSSSLPPLPTHDDQIYYQTNHHHQTTPQYYEYHIPPQQHISDSAYQNSDSSFYQTNYNAASSNLDFQDVNDMNISSSFSSFPSSSSLPYSHDEKGNRIYFTYDYPIANVDNTPPAYINSIQHQQNHSIVDHHNDVIAPPSSSPLPNENGYPHPTSDDHQSLSQSAAEQSTQPAAPPNSQPTSGFLSSITSTLASFKSWLFPEDDVTSTASGKKQTMAYYSPFSINPEIAQQRLEKWLSSLWFAPYGFAKSCKKDALRPSFVPYYIFSASSHTIYKTTVQKQLAKSEVEGIIENDYNNIVLCSSMNDERASFLKELEDDWKMQSAKNPSTELSVVLDKPKQWEEVWRLYSRTTIFPKEDELCREALRKQGFMFSEVSVNLGYKDVKSKLIYLPVYEGFYYYEGKRYKVAVNGHSGKVIGERPYGAGGLGALGNTLSGLFSKK